MTEKEYVKNVLANQAAIDELKKKSRELMTSYISEHCPYKIGQIIEFERTRTKNVGGFLSPKYEVVSRSTVSGVLTSIKISNIWSENCSVTFMYTFKQLKKDGTIGANEVCPHGSEIKWTDKFYNFENNTVIRL